MPQVILSATDRRKAMQRVLPEAIEQARADLAANQANDGENDDDGLYERASQRGELSTTVPAEK